MIIEISSIDGFLEELVSSQNPSVVRVDVITQSENSGVTDVSLTAGFHDDKYLYEAKFDLGRDYVGGPATAATEAKALVSRIKAAAKLKSVDCRTGRYQWPA